MPAGTKNRRGGKGKSKDKPESKPESKAASNGGEKLSVAEKRLSGANAGTRKKAVKQFKNGESINDIAATLDLSPIKARYLVMQQMVEDGDVPEISPTAEKQIVNALKSDGEYNSVAWVACRTGLSDGQVKRIAEDNGHSFDRGRPKTNGGGKAKKAGKAKAAASDDGGESKARRGRPAKGGKKRGRPKKTAPSS